MRLSWLYVPLLHAAAGNLAPEADAAWRSAPGTGATWAAIVATLRDGPPVDPQLLARMAHQAAEAEVAAGEATEPELAPALARARALGRLPPVSVPLAAALFFSCDAEGYVPAVVQAVLMEAYHTLASESQKSGGCGRKVPELRPLNEPAGVDGVGREPTPERRPREYRETRPLSLRVPPPRRPAPTQCAR